MINNKLPTCRRKRKVDNVIVGIDIGTTKICTMVGMLDQNNELKLLGKGYTIFNGVKKGVIVDVDETAKAIRNSVEEAETEARISINSAFVNIYGSHVNIIHHREKIHILNEDQIITVDDLERLFDAIERIPIPEGTQIIDIIPKQYIVDGYGDIRDPVGMTGLMLEVEADVVTGKLIPVKNIMRSMEKAGLEVDGITAGAFATGELLLSVEEKEMGVILVDVGGRITDVSAIKNGQVVAYDSIPVGGEHITNDIAIGLKISYSEADKIKRKYELALTTLIKNDQEVVVFDVNEEKQKSVQVSQIIEIIEARVYEILSLAKDVVERYCNPADFRAGVVLTGAGISYVNGNKQIAEEIFKMPVRVASYKSFAELTKPEYVAAAGIIKHMAKRNKFSSTSGKVDQEDEVKSKTFIDTLKSWLKSIYEWFS